MAELVDVPLFDLPAQMALMPAPEPERPLSAEARRTQRALVMLTNGYHPLGTRLHADAAPADDRKAPGLRCRSCVHVMRQYMTSGDYLKCDAHEVTRGPGSDIRRWWPACAKWEAES